MILCRRGVVAQMGLAVHGTAAADFLPHGIATLSKTFQQLYNLLIVGLVVCYKDCFHRFFTSFRMTLAATGAAFLAVLAEGAVNDRNEHQGNQGGDGQTPGHGGTQAIPHLGTFTTAQRHGQHT